MIKTQNKLKKVIFVPVLYCRVQLCLSSQVTRGEDAELWSKYSLNEPEVDVEVCGYPHTETEKQKQSKHVVMMEFRKCTLFFVKDLIFQQYNPNF